MPKRRSSTRRQRREQKRDEAATALGDARAALADAEAELGSWTARADGLAIALDDARARAGAEHLAGLDGMVGTLLDLVDIDEGWEHAFEAAVGEAMAAVVVDSIDTARTALRSFAAGNVSGAVLALGAQRKSTNTPSVGEPVRHHVRGIRSVGRRAARRARWAASCASTAICSPASTWCCVIPKQ